MKQVLEQARRHPATHLTREMTRGPEKRLCYASHHPSSSIANITHAQHASRAAANVLNEGFKALGELISFTNLSAKQQGYAIVKHGL